MFLNEIETQKSLRLLQDTVKKRGGPVVVWLGAGVSSWAGFPLWRELADEMHIEWMQTEPSYESENAGAALAISDFPAVFQVLKNSNPRRYHEELKRRFATGQPTATYTRLIGLLQSLSPLMVVTTNVDDTLERNIPGVPVLQGTDSTLLFRHLSEGLPFICKIHGSVALAESMIFSQDEYAKVLGSAVPPLLKHLFASAAVVFLGYGLADEYVVNAAKEANVLGGLFGAGPHFLVTPNEVPNLRGEVRQIRYKPSFADHRDALQVLEIILGQQSSVFVKPPADTPKDPPSRYLIANMFGPGKNTTSQTITFAALDSGEPVGAMMMGSGFVDGEIAAAGYSPLHDLIVGVTCFDEVIFPLGLLGLVHHLLGAEDFWMLENAGIIKFVYSTGGSPAVRMSDAAEIAGLSLTMVGLAGVDSTGAPSGAASPLQIIHKHINSAPGKEEEGALLIEKLSQAVIIVHLVDTEVMESVGRALVHPTVRGLLGLSSSFAVDMIPRWNAFPILRLADVVMAGEMCRRLGASATRLLWGSERLANVAFSAVLGEEPLDDVVGYVLAGKSGADVAALPSLDGAFFKKLLEFRCSAAGEDLRNVVRKYLADSSGSEMAAAVNAGLGSAVPLRLLERARSQALGIFATPPLHSGVAAPMILGDIRNGDQRIAKWRGASRAILQKLCEERGIEVYSPCLCGSGTKLKFCCMAPLMN